MDVDEIARRTPSVFITAKMCSTVQPCAHSKSIEFKEQCGLSFSLLQQHFDYAPKKDGQNRVERSDSCTKLSNVASANGSK